MLHGPAFSRLSMPTSCVDNVNPVKLGSSKEDDNPSLAAMQPRADTTLARTTTPSWRNCRARVMERFHGQQRARNEALSPGSRAARGNTLLRKLLPNARAGAGAFKRHGPARQVRSRRLLQPRHARARAENVAYGVRTEGAAIALWRSSPPHAANMRLPGCKAVAHACNGRRCYWTMEIGE